MSIWKSYCPTWTQIIVNTKEPKTSIWHKKLFQRNQGQFHWQQHCKSKREISWKRCASTKRFQSHSQPCQITLHRSWNLKSWNQESRKTNWEIYQYIWRRESNWCWWSINSFIQFKHFLNSNKDKPHELCEILAKPGVYKDIFPSFVTLAQVFQTIPLTSVPCKRGFSAQNHIHGALRNKMFPSAVECKMYISHASKTHVDLWGKCLW